MLSRIVTYSSMLLALLLSGPILPALHAQAGGSFEEQFNNAKLWLDEGKYNLAKEGFRPLTQAGDEAGNPYQRYASFYYGYAAYHAGEPQVAKNMFLQIIDRYPDWRAIDDVHFWLSRLYFEEGNPAQGLRYFNQIEDKSLLQVASPMKSGFLAQVTDATMVDSLYALYPKDKGVAVAKAKQIVAQPFTQQDRQLLNDIVTRFKLNAQAYDVVDQERSVKKDTYHVAVLLPFLIDQGNPFRRNRKGFVMELYEGMQLAAEDLKAEGVDIALHAYDTRRDSATTAAILDLDELKQMDLIVGPLYADAIGLAQQFSQAYKINIINPLSDNVEIIANNPYSFLHKAGATAKYEKAAELAQAAFDNKNCLVVYGESARDSLLAYNYKASIEAAGFQVVEMHKLERSVTRSIYNVLTAVYDADTDDERPKIAEDSIGHIFVASTNQVVVASSISAVAARTDNIPIIGFTDWLNLRVVRYEQLERLDLYMLGVNFVDVYSAGYERFTKEYRKQYAYYPSKNACTGYDLTAFVGKMLYRHGRYFQYALRDGQQENVGLSMGFDYRNSNDNRYIGIYRLEEAQPVALTIEEIKKQRLEAAEDDE